MRGDSATFVFVKTEVLLTGLQLNPRLSLLSAEVFIGVERTWTCAKVRSEQDASEHDRNK